jgi:hypothetical protein
MGGILFTLAAGLAAYLLLEGAYRASRKWRR